jgi:uncharacterized membrane protein
MLLTKHFHKLSNSLLIITGLVAIIGLVDALYLSITHYTNNLVPCNFTHGCETVLKSSYSEIFGVPVAALGVIFYLVVLSTSIFFVQHKMFHWWLSIWGLLGFVSTLYFLYLQAFVLHSFCQYCLLSAITSTVIFVLLSVLYFIHKKKGDSNANQS